MPVFPADQPVPRKDVADLTSAEQTAIRSALGAASADDIPSPFAVFDTGFIPEAARHKAARFVTTRATAPTITVRTTTGYARALNWDGTLTAVAGSGNPAENISFSWVSPVAPYNSRLPKFLAIWPTTENGLDVAGDITRISSNNNQLTALDVSGLTSLEQLNCFGNQLTALDVSGLTSLEQLNCFGNQLTVLNVSGLTSLMELYCENNQLPVLDVSGLTSLEHLYCDGNQLTVLDVSGLTSLEHLYCHSNQLTVLDVSGLTSLERLYCHGNQLTALDVSGLTSLERLHCYGNQLTVLDVSGLTSLEQLHCYGNQLNTAAIDAMLNSIEVDDVPGSGGIYATDNAPRSSASDAAVAVLESKDWYIETDA